MAVERKCLKCGEWNKDNEYCTSCEAPLAPEIIKEIKEAERLEKIANLPPTQLEVFVDKWKNHRFLLVRWSYLVLYSIWTVFMAIGGFFTWLAATTAG